MEPVGPGIGARAGRTYDAARRTPAVRRRGRAVGDRLRRRSLAPGGGRAPWRTVDRSVYDARVRDAPPSVPGPRRSQPRAPATGSSPPPRTCSSAAATPRPGCARSRPARRSEGIAVLPLPGRQGAARRRGARALRRGARAEAIDAACRARPTRRAPCAASSRLLAARLQSSDYQLGCPIATTALEQAATSPRCATRPRRVRALGRAPARRLQADGREPPMAVEQAVFALSAIEGALLLARAARSTRPLRIVLPAAGRPGRRVTHPRAPARCCQCESGFATAR